MPRHVLLAVLSLAPCAGLWAAQPSADQSARLDAWLAKTGQSYDAPKAMLESIWTGPGYHSKVPPGVRVHSTRSSLLYAEALVRRGRADDLARAADVIRAVLAQQDTDPASRTYGIWPWLLEEPLAKMAPPDWNWADFLGASLAEMLVGPAERLPRDLQAAMRTSLGHAAAAIRKRNVGPDYTNIAIMGGVVTAAAGEILADSALLAYGRDRLQRCVAHARHHGNFTEYNSPTYTMVALEEAERGLRLIRDPQARAAAEDLRRIAWRTIAESYHPATAQWAGPHSRAYSDRLSDQTLQKLADRTGLKLLDEPAVVLPHEAPPCPPDYAQRMRKLPADPLELQRPFARNREGKDVIHGVTWLTADAALGSVNRCETWVQRRAILGYWKTASAPAVFRVRLLKEGKDFSSGHLTTAQRGAALLTVLSAHGNRGDWHISLDRPKDAVFRIAELRWRFQVQGRGAAVKALGAGRYELACGPRRIVLRAADGLFDGAPVTWQSGTEQAGDETVAWVDAVCYRGQAREFNFRALGPIRLAAAAELLTADQKPTDETLNVAPADKDAVRATWGRLTVTAPMTVK